MKSIVLPTRTVTTAKIQRDASPTDQLEEANFKSIKAPTAFLGVSKVK